jgi:hypothetical protein
MSAIEVDLPGLRKQIRNRGTGWIVGELLQNAWDALQDCPNVAGGGNVNLTLKPVKDRQNMARIVVEDDSAAGFKDLDKAHKLYAESERKGDPSLRGRFGIGEKLVIAVSESASIISTTGSVHFKNDERIPGRKRRDAGTLIEAIIPMAPDALKEALGFAHRCISPANIVTTINGEILPTRRPLRTASCTLQTVDEDDQGHLVKRERKTEIRVLGKLDDKPWLYELGIPVVELGDDPFDIDVGQKVPLHWERNNVPPAWLTATFDMLDADLASRRSVTDAMAKASDDAVRHVIATRFPKAASWDMSDREANSQATAHGMTVLRGNTFDKETWEAIRRADAIKPAGYYHPTPKPFAKGGTPVGLVPPTPAMARIKAFCRWLAKEVLDHSIDVVFYEKMNDNRVSACYSKAAQSLGFNMRKLGKKWFEGHLNKEHLDLIAHEFGHDYAGDHLSMDYHAGLTEIAARITLLALERPSGFDLAAYEAAATP